MKIYTKFGDGGFTSLFGGKKVNKHDFRVEAYGNIDELNSYIGLVRDLYDDDNIKKELIEIQKKLFIIGAELSTPKKEKLTNRIKENDILFLEKKIDSMTISLPKITYFILPGGSILTSHCHIARSICRRAERKISFLKKKKLLVNNLDLKFINRLSDYIFTLSRKYTNDNKRKEIKWDNRL